MTLSRKIAFLIVKKNVSVDDVEKILRTYTLLSLLPSIRNAVIKLTKDEGRENTVHIESPFELNEEAVAKIKRIVGNDLAPHEIAINKNILAGFKARFKGKMYDGSAERILRHIIK